MADQKKLKRTAKKALAHAEEAVDDARRAAKKLDRKTRKKAAELAADLEKAQKRTAKALRRAAENTRDAARDVAEAVETVTEDRPTPVVRTVPTVDETEQARAVANDVAAGPEASGLEALGVRELRERAKTAGVPKYYALNKAALVEALSR